MENLNFDILLSKIDELFEEGKTYKDESQTKSNARWKDTPVAGKSGPMRNKRDKQRDDRQKSKEELRKLTYESAKKKKKLKDACWDGYEAIGTKKKNGKEVPNCVPIKESIQEIIETPKGVIKLKLFKDLEWGEWQVKFLKQIGNKFVNQPNLAYHASDKEDAIETLQQWASLYKQGKIQEGFDLLEMKGFTEPSRSNRFFFPETSNASYEDVKSDVLDEVASILNNVINGKSVEEVKEEAEKHVRNALSEDFWQWISSNIPLAMVGYEGEFDPETMEEIVDKKFFYDFERTMEDYMDIDEVVDNWYHDYNYTDLSEDYKSHDKHRVKREARTFKGAFEILDEAGKCTGPTQKASSTSKGKKWMQCVKNPDGKGYKRVHWGQKGVRVTGKSGNTKRKKSFRARHKCSTAKAGTAKAQACKDW